MVIEFGLFKAIKGSIQAIKSLNQKLKRKSANYFRKQ